MASAAPVIELHNLRVRFGMREILHGVDLTVCEGDFVAIVGRSGCGKSTLLNALAGFIEKEGEARIPSNFGFIFQNYAAFPWLTVRQNILFGMPRGLLPAEREQRLRELLETTDLAQEAGKYPAELSGGQVQRVGFARALARDPAVLLMDEPFGALDMYTREKMELWLLELCERQKQTIILVTHSIEEAIFLSDRIVVLADGSIHGSSAVPFGRPRSRILQYDPKFIELKKEVASILEAI
jgi:NitT/TauT family transport system ATP-binding protein